MDRKILILKTWQQFFTIIADSIQIFFMVLCVNTLTYSVPSPVTQPPLSVSLSLSLIYKQRFLLLYHLPVTLLRIFAYVNTHAHIQTFLYVFMDMLDMT